MSEDTPRDEDRRWRWSIPPVPEWRRSELQVLHDVEDALATTLWRAVRDVRAWVETAPESRAEIVRPPNDAVRERLAYAAAQAPELAGALGQFAHLLNAPASVQPHALAAACAVVAQWAEERALSETAVQFAEAAAAVDQENPVLANLAARVCKRAALHHHAEMWYQRGIGLARKAKDDVQYIKARAGYGELLADLGQRDRALQQILKAARRAAQAGLREEAAQTQHDLLNAYGPSGTLKHALDYAEVALHSYPVHHRRVPFLAHDFAYFLLTQQRYAEAYHLARQAVELIRVQDQALAWGTVAWAAAGAGLRDEYDAAKSQGEELASLFTELVPGTLCNISEGAALLNEWDEAERLAARALEAAQARSDSVIIEDAHALLDRLATRTPAARPETQKPNWRISSLALAFLHRLRVWKRE